MAYTKVHESWEDDPSVATPILAADLDQIEEGIQDAHDAIDGHIADGSAAHAASAISITDAAGDFTATDVEGALAELQSDAEAHLADGTAAHAAAAIAFTPGGTLAADNVQDAIEEAVAEFAVATGITPQTFDAKGELISSSAADTVEMVTAATADDLVLMSDAAEAAGMRWGVLDPGADALVDLTDVTGGPPATGEAPVWDGDSFEYTNVATQAELDAVAAALSDHLTDTVDAHDASSISIVDAGGDFTATTVEGALDELQADAEAEAAARVALAKKWAVVFTARSNEPPASAYATLDTRNSHAVLDFDAGADESAVFRGLLPAAYAGGGLKVSLHWTTTSATSGNVIWEASIERIGVNLLDIDGDSFATAVTATAAVDATIGEVIQTDFLFASGSAMDSLAAGEQFRVKIVRDANNGSDTAAGDAELLLVVVTEQ